MSRYAARPARARRSATLVVTLFAVLLAAACSSGGSGAATTPGATTGATSPPASGSRTLTVLAAASLTESFTAIARTFEAAHPGTKVVLSFGASSSLAQQAINGAPADVFASASQATMDQVVKGGAAQGSEIFARNVGQIVVPKNNPAGLAGIADLTKPGVKVAVCQPTVPCGVVADELFRAAGLAVTPVTRDSDVRAVLTKVRLGEVDAGIVYTTDAAAAKDDVQAIPTQPEITTNYPITVLRQSGEPQLAAELVALVRSAAGQQVLADHGFRSP